MTRMLRFLMWGGLLIGLTSCGPKAPQTPPVVTPPPTIKPVPPVLSPLPTPEPALITHKIGVLLPLSGPHADLGQGLLEAAELALFEGESSSIALVPQDTARDAHAAAQKALNEGAELLLGPVFAPEVTKIKPLLSSRQVNLICFSTDQTVAGHGTYVLGFLPSQQIERIVEYAKEKGLTKIAALTPQDQYGKLIDQTLRQLETQGRIQLLGITHYEKGDILDGNPGNSRILEEVTTYKSQGVDALLIPEGGENLALLMRLLGPQGSLKILGSGQWDTPETLHIPGLEGGLFASTNPDGRENFEARFQKAYGHPPPRIAGLAYDAIALALALADKGYTSDNLTFSQGFAGTEGLFRLTPEGLNERGLAVLEVNPSGFRIASPAPQSF